MYDSLKNQQLLEDEQNPIGKDISLEFEEDNDEEIKVEIKET